MEEQQQIEEQELNPAISEYILTNCQNKPRYKIEQHLMAAGHSQEEINATWDKLLQKQILLPIPETRRPRSKLWAGLLVLVAVLVILSFLFGPRTQETVYRNPDQLRNEAKIGEKATLMIRNTGTVLTCHKTSEDMTECFWQAKEDSSSGVIIRFPKSKNLAPSSAGLFNEVRILERQGDKLITEIEREYNFNG